MKEKFIIGLFFLLYFSPLFYQIVLVFKERKRGDKKGLKKVLNFLKFSVLGGLLVVSVFMSLSHTNYLNYEKPLRFDSYDQITFENFRGLEFFKKDLYGNKKFAYVVSTIECDLNENSGTVYSLFHPSRSFVYKKNIYSEELLRHEKYHIKITELYVRKAKHKMASLRTFSKSSIEEIVLEMKFEESAFQKKYDYDTFHSYVLSEQNRYEKSIDSLLYLLADFKIPKIIINDKN